MLQALRKATRHPSADELSSDRLDCSLSPGRLRRRRLGGPSLTAGAPNFLGSSRSTHCHWPLSRSLPPLPSLSLPFRSFPFLPSFLRPSGPYLPFPSLLFSSPFLPFPFPFPFLRLLLPSLFLPSLPFPSLPF